MEALFLCLNYFCDMRLMIAFLLIGFSATTSTAQVTDTLGFGEFYSGTPTLYGSPNGGYAFGINGYGDKAKAQSYSDTVSFVLRGALIEFGFVSYNSLDSSSVVRVTVYDNDGYGVTQYGDSDSIAPSSVITFVDVPMFELAVSGTTLEAYFEGDPVVIRSRFSVGIDLTQLSAGDTVGLMSTTDGDAMGATNSWELTSTGTWFTLGQEVYSWGLDVDLAIFPLIDTEDPAGVEDADQNLLNLYPNPASTEIWIDAMVSKSTTVDVFDVFGNKIFVDTFSGTRNRIDITEFSSGVYIAVITINGVSVARKFLKN